MDKLIQEIIDAEVEETAIMTAIFNDNQIIDDAIRIINDGFDDVQQLATAVLVSESTSNDLLAIRPRLQRVRTSNFFEKIIPQFTDEQFHSHFKMSRTTFEELVRVLTPLMIFNNSEGKIPIRKKILLTLWMLATTDSFQSVANRFGISKNSSYSAFKEVIQILTDLVSKYIKWPTMNEYEIIETGFARRFQFPGIIGVIDCCHIKIKQPSQKADDYNNGDDTYSVILQGVCDHTGKFIDVLIGRPGSATDFSVFRSSPIHKRLKDANHPFLPIDFHLLGDKAFPLSVNLLTPFRNYGDLTVQQINYNEKHELMRSIIERTFGLLKLKFRRLHYLDVNSIGMANSIIAASCVLHNFILIYEDGNIGNNGNDATVDCENGNSKNNNDANSVDDDDDDYDWECEFDFEEDPDVEAIDKRLRIMKQLYG